MSTPTLPNPLPELLTRITKDGRKLTYSLTVIQQPERARACGSGAKASADRRPVDPPPVVELRIFEGEAKNDITFQHNANFFLFATLELARPIANGRVQAAPQQIPVLTGMPVSGMAYLDRPSEAGYFIFPDLAVRHEGKYKLSFNLYEETKDKKDEDAEPRDLSKYPGETVNGQFANGSFDWRMEIKSAPFIVYSAKKFPGLTESTHLSRTVAEQGCRVRIRRDVRMRRREGKASDDDDYNRVGRTPTPDIRDTYNRERSVSRSSVETQEFAQEQNARSSGMEYAQSYSNPAPAPAGGNLSFIPAQQFQGPASFPQSHAPPPPMQSQPQPYAPAQSGFHPAQQYRPHPTANQYGYQDRPAYVPYPGPRDQYENDYRRSSVGYPPQANQYPAADQTYHRTQSMPSFAGHPPRAPSPQLQPQHPASLAPLKMALEPKYDAAPAAGGALQPSSRAAPPPSSHAYPPRSNSYSHYPATQMPIALEPARAGKRTYDSVFSTSAFHQPLHNGMRPADAHQAQQGVQSYDDEDAEEAATMAAFQMQYRRADGTPYSRALPMLD